ncbi:hypothetical protein MAR_035334, partial [Mya arenaria]
MSYSELVGGDCARFTTYQDLVQLEHVDDCTNIDDAFKWVHRLNDLHPDCIKRALTQLSGKEYFQTELKIHRQRICEKHKQSKSTILGLSSTFYLTFESQSAFALNKIKLLSIKYKNRIAAEFRNYHTIQVSTTSFTQTTGTTPRHFIAKDHITVDVSGILSSTAPDFLSDVDSTEYFQVMAVQSKKFADGKCPSCNKMPDTEQHNGSAMVILKKKDRFSQVRFFMDNLKKLFKVDDITDSNKLLQQLKTQVPVTARGRFTNTVWYNLSRVSTTVMAGYSPTTSCLIDIVYHLDYTQSQTLQTECSQISSYTVWGLLHHLELRNPSCRKTLVNNMYVTGNLDGCRGHDNDYGKLINNLFEQVENAEHTCDPHKVITILAHAQIVTHPDAHPCSDVQVGTNEDLVLNACNLTAPTTWTRGVNVITICSSIPKYTPIASFQSSTGYSYHAEGGEQSGVLLECDTDGNGFK